LTTTNWQHQQATDGEGGRQTDWLTDWLAALIFLPSFLFVLYIVFDTEFTTKGRKQRREGKEEEKWPKIISTECHLIRHQKDWLAQTSRNRWHPK
jgi:hypothetical protein